jgi:methyl-accepting chemotaxis protein
VTQEQVSGGGWRRLMSDRSVGTKILAAVLIVAALSVFDGVLALNSLGSTNGQVKAGYQLSQQLDTVGSLRSAVNRTWLAVSDYQLAPGANGRGAAQTALSTAESQVDEQVSGLRAFALAADAGATLDGFEADWSQYRQTVDDVLLPLATRGDRSALAEARTTEIAPLMAAVRGRLTSLAEMAVKATAVQETAAEGRYQTTKWWVIIMLAGSAVLGIGLGVGVTRLIVRPLSRCVAALDRIADGDLTARVTVDSADEVGRMSGALNRTAESVAGMVTRVHSSSDLLASASEQLSSVAIELSTSAEEASAQVSSVSESADRVSEGVNAVSAGTDEMGVSIREIANSANEAAGVAADAARTAESTNTSVARLGEASAQIGTVVALITSIAEQTNLLALNATIEAARAGESGKGFAVVASEVKDLAQETARATQDITAQVARIQDETGTAVTAIGEIGQVIATINAYATTIAAAVEEQTATTAEIARSVGHAAEGSSSIAGTIAGVAQAAQQVTAGATETQQTAAELARTAADLQTIVAAYRI